MSAPDHAIARRLAARFAPEIDARLPALTERALRDEPAEESPFRSADPFVLNYASFLISLASLAWTIYKDLRKKEPSASEAFLQGMLAEHLRQQASVPPQLEEPVRERLLDAAAEEAIEEARRAVKS